MLASSRMNQDLKGKTDLKKEKESLDFSLKLLFQCIASLMEEKDRGTSREELASYSIKHNSRHL